MNCLIGTQLGKRFGHLFENKLEIIAGIVLVLIGLKILFEHLVKNIQAHFGDTPMNPHATWIEKLTGSPEIEGYLGAVFDAFPCYNTAGT